MGQEVCGFSILSGASNVSLILDHPLGGSALHGWLGPSEFLFSLLLVLGLCFWLLWLWSCGHGSSLCVKLPLEALSMPFDDLSTWIQVLSDTWKTGQQRLFWSWWFTSIPGLGQESTVKGSGRTFP